jgi:hypothetical protein
MYKYLILTDQNKPFFTNYYEYENHYNNEITMIVFDLINNLFTADGINWEKIEEDHL